MNTNERAHIEVTILQSKDNVLRCIRSIVRLTRPGSVSLISIFQSWWHSLVMRFPRTVGSGVVKMVILVIFCNSSEHKRLKKLFIIEIKCCITHVPETRTDILKTRNEETANGVGEDYLYQLFWILCIILTLTRNSIPVVELCMYKWATGKRPKANQHLVLFATKLLNSNPRKYRIIKQM